MVGVQVAVVAGGTESEADAVAKSAGVGNAVAVGFEGVAVERERIVAPDSGSLPELATTGMSEAVSVATTAADEAGALQPVNMSVINRPSIVIAWDILIII